MSHRLFALLFLLALLALASGCPKQGASGGLASGHGAKASRHSKYPIPFPERPYTTVNDAAKQAWFLVETSYVVIHDKYKNATGQRRGEVGLEIDKNIFGVNPKVEQLFKDAIKAEPDNPLNIATYAFYLKPRKRFTKQGFTPCDVEALDQMDKAIKLWPDEPSFYLEKIFIWTAPHLAHDWLRAGAGEDAGIGMNLPQVNDNFTLAEKYDPQNHFVNYWRALLNYRYTDPAARDSISDDLLREIRAGNGKPLGNFVFFAPLPPYNLNAQLVVLYGGETEARYVDQWTQCGTYSADTVNEMILGTSTAPGLADKLTWPKDKDRFADLMYMYYNLGRTDPFDRSYFSMQLALLDKMRKNLAKGSPDIAKFAEVARFLDDQYQTVANEFYQLKVITDPAKVNVVGINEVENGASRQPNVKDHTQGPEAAYLSKFGKVFGIKFPLPKDPAEW